MAASPGAREPPEPQEARQASLLEPPEGAQPCGQLDTDLASRKLGE